MIFRMPTAISRFASLNTFLETHQAFWQFLPFDTLSLPWQTQSPDLCAWLSSLSLAELHSYKNNPIALAEKVAAWLPALKGYQALCHVQPANKTFLPFDFRLEQGIPGRKKQQIDHFNAALPIASEPTHWLEWCAGKGYLGRAIAATRDAKVTSLEWQQTLCEEGQAFAHKHELNMHYVHANAFAESSTALVKACDHAIALHACGELHIHLLKTAVANQTNAITISPCCYHLIKNQTYQPLSKAGQASSLVLFQQDLKLPLQETVTAGKSVQNMRFIEVAFRLGFDKLQREIFQQASYLPLPNIQNSQLKLGFKAFCLWAGEQKGLQLPKNVDFARFEQEGQQRFLLVERMETLRTLFRRPLELWLSYDKILFLIENNYSATLSEFCERKLTPRNLLISTHLSSYHH